MVGETVVHVSRRNWILLVCAIAGISFAAILARMAQDEGVPSLVISFWRLLFSTVMLAPFAVRSARTHPIAISGKQWLVLAAVGFLLAAHFAVWVTSLEYTSVASSVVIVTTESLWVPLGTAYLLREHVGWRVWAGVAVAFAGSILLVSGDAGDTRFGGLALLGDFLAFAGAIAASLYFLAGRVLRQRYSLPVYATIVYGFASVFLLAMALLRGDALIGYTTRAFAIMFAFALFPMIVGHTLINYVLRWVPAYYVSTGVLAEPVVSAFIAFLLFQETVTVLVLVGSAVILAGILVATTGERSVPPAPVAPPAT